MAACQFLDHIVILLAAGTEIADGKTETSGKRELLLHGIVLMHIIADMIRSVIPAFADKMTPVACRIDEDVVRLHFETAFDDCLEVFIFNLEILEGKIIHIDDEFIVAVFHLGDDALEIRELVLVDFNHA